MPWRSSQHHEPSYLWSSHSSVDTDPDEGFGTCLPTTGTAELIAVSQSGETLELFKVETENKDERKNLFSSEF